MNVTVVPAGPLRGELAVPPDKSISHRLAILGAMSDEPVRITNYLQAQDTLSTLAAVEAVGALVEREGGEVTIRGTGLRNAHEPDGPIDVGNSGTLMRLLPGWLAGQEGRSFTLDGDESIRRRPVDRIAAPLELMGAGIEATDGRLPPLTINGSRLHGIEYELPVASAQVKSCLCFAALVADGETTIVEPVPSRDHTERLLAACGARIERDGNVLTVFGADEIEMPPEVEVPGDPSSAAFMLAAGMIVPGSRLLLTGCGVNWTRTGFMRIAERMGGVLIADFEERAFEEEIPPDQPVSEVDVTAGPLVATTVEAEEVPLAIDELPLVALLGCFADGETVVRGAGELRLKESDRIASVVGGLTGLGADAEATDDGFVVRGTGGLRGGSIDARGDHRLAMLGAIAGLASQEGVEIVGAEAMDVSYPRFLEDLAALR
ncbi:MAG: 3-phosphoshikimate 1-carboxyvinyltransferase [Solirubrobacterales bacterium]